MILTMLMSYAIEKTSNHFLNSFHLHMTTVLSDMGYNYDMIQIIRYGNSLKFRKGILHGSEINVCICVYVCVCVCNMFLALHMYV